MRLLPVSLARYLLSGPALSAAAFALNAHGQDNALPPPVETKLPWKPAPGLRWQVQYTNPLQLGIAADVYMVDLFDTNAKVISSAKSNGKRLVCYINAGAWEGWRPDKDKFPKAVLGSKMIGWDNEIWLDTRSELLKPIMAARLDLCRKKGFDGVIFDNVNSHTNVTGFPLTPDDSLRYNAWLANEARSRGLAAGMNNNSLQTSILEPYFDWALAESCFEQGWCKNFTPFVANGQAVVAIEYGVAADRRAAVCEEASALKFDVMYKGRDLDANRQDCRDNITAELTTI